MGLERDVFVVGGARTAIGAFRGALAAMAAPELGAIALRGALARAGAAPAAIDEVLMGCVLSAGVGQAPARQAALGAGVPVSVPCTTINKVCGSGMKAAMLAAQAIRCGDAELVLAGGMESMSNAPYLLPGVRAGIRLGSGRLVDSVVHDGLWDPGADRHMGACGDAAARELGLSREELDGFAAESYRRALAAQASGRLAEEIVPVAVPDRRAPGGTREVVDDEEPARGDPRKLAALRAAFTPDGVTTAGNASSLDDGAAALVLASGAAVERHALRPIVRLVAAVTHAQEPTRFPTAPTEAIRKLLARTGLSLADIDVFEINEAFAVVALGVARQLGIDAGRLNPNGGAVALGHPIGMTGARLLLTAAVELHRRGGGRAIATPCIGGGEATAVLLEAV